MAQISVTIAGRVFRMACNDGEEEHLAGLAAQVDGKIAEMRAGFGEIGDQRLTVMAAITIADELSEAKRRIAALEAEAAASGEARAVAEQEIGGWAQRLADALDDASLRIEGLSQQMNAGGRKP